MDDDDTFLTLTEVAQMLRVNERTIVKLIRTHELHGYKIASVWRITRSAVRDYLENRATPPEDMPE
jgi:excisionase family DNA binding protein